MCVNYTIIFWENDKVLSELSSGKEWQYEDFVTLGKILKYVNYTAH